MEIFALRANVLTNWSRYETAKYLARGMDKIAPREKLVIVARTCVERRCPGLTKPARTSIAALTGPESVTLVRSDPKYGANQLQVTPPMSTIVSRTMRMVVRDAAWFAGSGLPYEVKKFR